MGVRGRIGGGVAVVVVVGAAAGWFVVQRESHEVLEQAVARFRDHLGPDVRFSYASAVPSVLHRDARFSGVVLAGPDSTVNADTVVVGCDAASVCSGTADGVRLTTPDAAAVSGTADHVGWTRLSVPDAGGPGGTAGGMLGGALGGRFDAAEARGVRLAGGNGEVVVAAAAMSDYGVGRRGRGTVDGVAVSLPDPSAGSGAAGGGAADGAAPRGPVRLRVAHAGFDGVDVASVAGAVRAGVPMAGAQGRQTLEASGVDFEQGGAAVLHVGRFASVNETPESGAAHGVADATDLALDGPAALAAALHGLGYARFEGDVHVDAALDRAAGSLTIAALRVAGRGMGTATLAGGFGHVPQATGGAPDPVAVMGVTVRGLDLALADDGLLQRVLDAKARASGVDEGVLREGMARQVEAVPAMSDAGRSVRTALATFVRMGGTLTLGVHPAAELTTLAMAQAAGRGPDGAVQALGLTAAAK